MAGLIGEEIRAVLFDWDDTLVATIENKWAQHKHVAKTFYNRELLDADLRRHWGKPLREMVALLYETDDIDQAIDNLHLVNQSYPKILFDATLGVVES